VPFASVELTVAGEPAGATTASAAGAFESPVAVPGLDPGRYEVVARCGPELRAVLDVVVVQAVDNGLSTLAVLVFFVLVALLLFRRRRIVLRRPLA
jgi:hypothetical protein